MSRLDWVNSSGKLEDVGKLLHALTCEMGEMICIV